MKKESYGVGRRKKLSEENDRERRIGEKDQRN
jgi:hypothetical protein